MKTLRLPFAALLGSCLLLAGCGQKRIDGSSQAAFEKSLEALGNGLSEAEQKKLAESVMIVALEGTDLFQLAAAPGIIEQRMRTSLDGLGYDEIVKRAEKIEADRAIARAAEKLEEQKREAERAVERERIRIEREEQEATRKAARKRGIEGEIAELVAANNKAASDAAALQKFAVQRSRFYFSETRFSTDPVIEVTVKNDLPSAVSRAHFSARLTSPGRSVPWVVADFNYRVPGGLEAGEEATWKLSPNMFSEWGRAPRDRSDLVLTVDVKRVDGVDGEPMHDAVFPNHKAERLIALQDSLLKGDY